MIELKHINLNFKNNYLLIDQNITINDQKITLITGQSGCGKSTLLFEIAGYTHYSKNQYYLDGKKITDNQEFSKLKKEKIGFVFQDCRLFDELTPLQNIELYTLIAHNEFVVKKVMELVDDLHLHIDLHGSVKTLSGGEKQRLLLLCCLMKNPDIIFLDEPTAYLDQKNKVEIRNILLELSIKYHNRIVVASHDLDMLEIADIHYHIENKQIILKKTCDCISFKNENKRIKTNPIRFYLQSIKKNKIHLKRNIVISLLAGIVTYLMCFQIHYQNAINDFINKAIYNELRISYQPGGNAYDITGKEVPQLLLNDLSNNSMIHSISAFYQWEVSHIVVDNETINEEVVIQPYNSYQKMNTSKAYDKHNLIIDNQIFDDDKIYVSSSLYKIIKKKDIDIFGTIEICKNNQFEFSKLPFHLINGDVLDEEIINRYTQTTENIIYFPQKLCQKIINQFIEDYTYCSNVYLLELNSYTDFNAVKQFIKKHDDKIYIYNPISDVVLNQTSSQGQKMINRFANIVFIIFIVACLLICVFDIISHRFQYALLLINGLKKKECLKLVFMQRFLPAIIAYIFTSSMVMSMFKIQYQLLSDDIIKNTLFILLLIYCLILFVPCILFMIMFFIKEAGEILKSS